MLVIITLTLINVYCLTCLIESLIGSPENEPKWNAFYALCHYLEEE